MARHLVRSFFHQFRTNFIAGFFLLIPVAGSIFIFVKLFNWADKALPKALGMHWPPFTGLIVTVLIVYLVGLLAKNYFGRKIIAVGNAIITSIPLLNKIYLGIKQVIDTISVDKKKLFERAVLLEFPHPKSLIVGFVTSENNEQFSVKAGKKLIAVFVPTVPNPTTGFLLYLTEDSLITLDMPVESVLKLIVSVGLLGTGKTGNTQKYPLDGNHWNWTDIFKRKPGRDPYGNPRD
ncbi:MAG: DUF502 domain-containing protein [Chitinispirillaceae bacterium]|nr:DUF502 domain-containing protein [Chitinispirillaceae bacterium]